MGGRCEIEAVDAGPHVIVVDPSGNVLEFKAFADSERLFESEG